MVHPEEAAASANASTGAIAATTAAGQTTALAHTPRRSGRGAGGRRRSPYGKHGKGKPTSQPGEKTSAAATSATTSAVAPPPTPMELLLDAIRCGKTDTFRAVLTVSGQVDVNTRTPQGDVLLVEACRYARYEMAAMLVRDKQADVNLVATNKAAQRDGLSPLIAACMTLEKPLVELLLSASTSMVNMVHSYGFVNAVLVCVLFAAANGYTVDQQERGVAILELLLGYAEQHDQIDAILSFQSDKGMYVQHTAAAVAHWEALRLLKLFNADLTKRSVRGHTPLQVVEMNAFQRRVFVTSMPKPDTTKGGKKKKKRGAQRQDSSAGGDDQTSKKNQSDGAGGVDTTSTKEPESAADKEVQVHAQKRVDRTAEGLYVTCTLLELSNTTGVGSLFSRKGDDGIRAVYLKSLILAHAGIVSIANEIAQLPDDMKEKPIYLDGFMYSVTNLYPLSLKSNKDHRDLWVKALKGKPAGSTTTISLTPKAFEMITESLFSHRSLSRRVKIWTMVLMHLLTPYSSGNPYSANQVLPIQECSRLHFYLRVTEAMYRSGTKLLFCIFDRTDFDDESYDEEVEFHLLIALSKHFLQFFAPFAKTIQDETSATKMTVASVFQAAIQPFKKLWPLVEAGLGGLDESIASPQRFSLVLHILQVFEQLEAAFLKDEDGTLSKFYGIMKKFVKQDAAKKRIDYYISSQVHLLQTIATAFPLPLSFVEKISPLKAKLDILIRSDAKILGMDLYALATTQDLIRLEHKVDYLGILAEEHSGSVSVSLSRASAASYVEFILQQVLSTSSRNMKGELNITLINEPGVGVGVIREFFQIVQTCFFNPNYHSKPEPQVEDPAPPQHVSEIGTEWLQLARSQGRSSARGVNTKLAVPGIGKDEFINLFPLFEFSDKERKHDLMRIVQRKLHISKQVLDAKRNDLQLTQDDVIVKKNEVETLKKLYQCVGRLIGLAIRNHQPLNANFPLAFWKFMLQQPVTWEEYAAENDVFKRSLQFVLDHDFAASLLEIQFDYTTEFEVIDDHDGEQQPVTTVMEMELQKGMGNMAVTNKNKQQYVELRAKQFFFGNELEYYKKMRDGLLETILPADLRLFLPRELRQVVRGELNIDLSSLKNIVLYSRGASPTHGVIKRFWRVVDEFDQEMRAKLLTFWSGSPMPPLFGFESKYRYMNADTGCWYVDVDSRMNINHCPKANTCDRRLILPDYPTTEHLKEKLLVALTHGAVGYDRM